MWKRSGEKNVVQRQGEKERESEKVDTHKVRSRYTYMRSRRERGIVGGKDGVRARGGTFRRRRRDLLARLTVQQQQQQRSPPRRRFAVPLRQQPRMRRAARLPAAARQHSATR